MKRVILESPFAGRGEDSVAKSIDREQNIEFARRCLRDCALRDESALASHLIWTQPHVLDDDNPEERKLGIALGLAWSSVADYHVFYTDRGWSRGMMEALYFCLKAGKELYIRGLAKDPILPELPDDFLDRGGALMYLRTCLEPRVPLKEQRK